jgi:hypothetical protein
VKKELQKDRDLLEEIRMEEREIQTKIRERKSNGL